MIATTEDLIRLYEERRAQDEEARERRRREVLAGRLELLREGLSEEVWRALGIERGHRVEVRDGWVVATTVYDVASLPRPLPLEVALSQPARSGVGATLEVRVPELDFELLQVPECPPVKWNGETWKTERQRETQTQNALALGRFLAKLPTVLHQRFDRTREELARQLQLPGTLEWHDETQEALRQDPYLTEEQRCELLTMLQAARQQVEAIHRESVEKEAEAERRSEKKQQAREVARQKAHILAKEWLARWEDYYLACHTWAEQESDRLWEPFSLLKIRYATPDAHKVLRDPCTEGRCGIMLEECLAVAHVLPGGCDDQGFYSVVSSRGQIKPMRLAAILDEERLHFDQPSIEHAIPHCRTYTAGGYFVNVPPHLHEAPQPAPPLPLSWNQAVEKAGLPQWVAYRRAEEWVEP
ncbi:MAG: hypothetical protein M3220_00305 [Chloroflexota bacterium]|nr:hypothetical protein [Chloroflexota bacterium]